jgi:hypothetical protein
MTPRPARFALHNRMAFHISDQRCCLPWGGVAATLSGHFPDLAAGMFLAFEEIIGLLVIPSFLVGVGRRIYAAAFSFWAGGIAPAPRRLAMVWLQTMKGMFGRSLLQVHGHCVAKS